MPHLEHSGADLDRLFPSIPPPEDDKLDDLVDDRADVVYQKGLRISEQITAETSAQGRRRRPTLSTLRRPKGDAPDIGRRRSTNDVQARRSLWTAMTTHDNDAQVPRDLCALDTLPRATTTAPPYTGSTIDPATPYTTNSLLPIPPVLAAPSLASQVPAAPCRLSAGAFAGQGWHSRAQGDRKHGVRGRGDLGQGAEDKGPAAQATQASTTSTGSTASRRRSA